MDIGNKQILGIIRKNLSLEDIEHSFVYWDRKLLLQGEEIRIGPQTFVMPFDGTLIFIDLAPRANWAHPCRYLLVDINTLNTEVIEASFPPNVDVSSETFIILLRYGKEPPHERYFQIFDE